MLRTPAHFSPITFLEAVTVAGGDISTPEAQVYSALHKTQGISHSAVNLETRIPHLIGAPSDSDFIYDLRERIVSWLEYVLNTNGINLVDVPTSVDIRKDEELISFLSIIHRNINDRFNSHVAVWQKKAKTAEQVSNELHVAREVAAQTEVRVDKAQAQLDRAEKSDYPDTHRIEKAQLQLSKAITAHALNMDKVNGIQSQLDEINGEFLEIRTNMVPLRKLESVSRYLNIKTEKISDNHVVRTIQEIVTSFPEWWVGVLNIVDGRVIPQRY